MTNQEKLQDFYDWMEDIVTSFPSNPLTAPTEDNKQVTLSDLSSEAICPSCGCEGRGYHVFCEGCLTEFSQWQGD